MWILYGLLSAAFDSSKNLLTKKIATSFHPLVITWATTLFSIPFILPILFFIPIPEVDSVFWLVLGLRSVLDTWAGVLHTKSIADTDLSLGLPILSLTPVIVVITSFFLNHEIPTIMGLIGILLVTIGLYALNYKKGHTVLEPILALGKNAGARSMLMVACIWGVTTSLHSVAIRHSSALFYAIVGMAALAILLTITLLLSKWKSEVGNLNKHSVLNMGGTGIFNGLTIVTQMIGQSMGMASYVIALKRVSILFSSVGGAVFFGEQIRDRIVPIVIMIVGVFLIILG